MKFSGRILTSLTFVVSIAAAVCAAPQALALDITGVAAKSGKETPSGYAVPRMVSLKFNNINGRSGPSKGHPVKWNYRRKGLPVIVVAETEMWRKVRDPSGDESWMHKRTLDGRRMVLTLQDATLYLKPRKTSKTLAIVSKDTLLLLTQCDADGWCEVKADTGHIGFVRDKTLWGANL